MKKFLFLLAPAFLTLASCSNNDGSSSSLTPSNVIEAVTCSISITKGGTAKAYKDGSLLGEIKENKPLTLSSLSIGDSFTVQLSFDEGYAIGGATFNGKKIASDTSYYKVIISENVNELSFSFRLIESKASDFTYEFDNTNSTATITGYTTGEVPTPLIVPSSVTEKNKTYAITKIAKDAFANTEITKIQIPSSIKEIEHGAFNNAYNMVSYSVDEGNTNYSSKDGILYNKDFSELHTLPVKYSESSYTMLGSVTSIADYALYQNRSIKGITFNDKIVSIGESAFYNSTFLETISFPKSLKTIGKYAFYQNSNLKSVTFSEGLETIDDYGFYGCLKIPSLAFPNSLKTIGGNSFFKCDRLSEIDFGNGVEEIEESAFSNETNITKLSFPSSLKKIGNSAFSVCDKLETIAFSEGLEEIGNASFALCSSLTKIALPASLKTIGPNPFYAVLKLNETNFSVSSSSEYFTVVDGVLYSKDMKKLVCYPYGKTNEEYSIPSGVEELSARSFAYINNLKTLVMPKSVKKLDECFYSMTSSLTVKYQGSQKEWDAIDKTGNTGLDWNYSSSVTVTFAE